MIRRGVTLLALTFAAGTAFSWATGALGHSLEEVEGELRDREPYAEITDREAPGFELQDAQGTRVSLAGLGGKVVVLNFVYASCPDLCPLHSERIAEVQRMVNQTPMKDLVQFVTITTDPTRDTPEVLAAYGPAHGLDPANWVFVTSGADDPETPRLVARDYGLEFTETGDGMQMHGAVTHLIDRNGRLRARYHGLDFDHVNLVVHLNALVNDHPHEHPEPSLWDRFTALF